MKRVLIYAPTAPSSGITQYILNILSTFDTEQVHFDILSFKNHRLRAWCESHGTEYIEFDLSPYKQRKAYMQKLRDIFSRDYCVIHYHLSALSELAILKLAQKDGRRIIVHSHNTFVDVPSKLRRTVFGQLHKFLRRRANRYSDVKCACSRAAAIWMFGEAGKDALVMNNAIDTARFTYRDSWRQELRAQHGIEEACVIGHIGRFSVQKNQPFLLSAFSHMPADYALVLIGEGDLMDASRQRAAELGLADRVYFIDFQENIHKYYSLFDLFVLPSLFEGLPITLIEAQAAGLQALVSDTVTADSDLTGLLTFFPLSAGEKAWSEKITALCDLPRQSNTEPFFAAKGFSLKAQTRALYALYFER